MFLVLSRGTPRTLTLSRTQIEPAVAQAACLGRRQARSASELRVSRGDCRESTAISGSVFEYQGEGVHGVSGTLPFFAFFRFFRQPPLFLSLGDAFSAWAKAHPTSTPTFIGGHRPGAVRRNFHNGEITLDALLRCLYDTQ
jgi:hypothetical protein